MKIVVIGAGNGGCFTALHTGWYTRNNPLPWTEHWISSKGLQVAPQETEVESYIVGGIKQDVKKDTFSGFKL